MQGLINGCTARIMSRVRLEAVEGVRSHRKKKKRQGKHGEKRNKRHHTPSQVITRTIQRDEIPVRIETEKKKKNHHLFFLFYIPGVTKK